METEVSAMPALITEKTVHLVPHPKHLKKEDFKHLNNYQLELVSEELMRRMQLLGGQERDDYQQQIEKLLDEPARREVWESNHAQITTAINNFINMHGCIPTKTELSRATGLSRNTIYRHLEEYSSSAHYHNQVEQLKFLSSHMLAQVSKRAFSGDNAATRLFFTITGDIGKGKAWNNMFKKRRGRKKDWVNKINFIAH